MERATLAPLEQWEPRAESTHETGLFPKFLARAAQRSDRVLCFAPRAAYDGAAALETEPLMTDGEQQPEEEGFRRRLDQAKRGTPSSDSAGTAAASAGDPEADLRLVQQALAGHAPAQELLAERLNCIPRLVAARLRRYGATGEIDVRDLSQDVFARAWPRMESFRGEGTLEGWIWGFVVRIVYGALTRPGSGRLEAYDLDQIPAAEQDALPDPVASVLASLDRLSERDREIITLRAMEKFDYGEIAGKLECTERAAKGRYHRAMARLRSLLEDGA